MEQRQWLAGRYHRIPKPVELTVELQNLPPEGLKCRLYDLNEKKSLRETDLNEGKHFDLGTTDRDFFVLITPA